MNEPDDEVTRGEQNSLRVSSRAVGDNGATALAPRQTGPRTAAGKQRSRYNATKHGIFSSVVVLEGESRRDYESLLDGLQNSFLPVGEIEQLMVEKLAMLLWSHRRLVIAEGAEIRNGREFLEWDRKRQPSLEAVNQTPKQADGNWGIPELRPKEGLIWHAENPEILDRCLELLGKLREEIETEGLSLQSQEAESILKALYGPPWQDHLNETLYDIYRTWCDTAEVSEEERQQEGYASPEECKENALQAVTAEIRRLKGYKKERLAVETRRTEVEKLRQGVPDSPSLDRLLRYEASLERAFDRTLSQLERLQRMRLGQPVPPQVKVELSKS